VRIGVFGGTFNPPHLGHLICAQEAYLQLDLDRVIFIPTATPPHKSIDNDPGPGHRLELCRLAVGGDEERLAVSDLEVRRAGMSYTVDTLVELSSRSPDNELFLILGGDIAAGLPRWHEPERVLRLATPALAGRRGTPPAAVQAALDSLAGGERAICFDMPTVAISSTLIRERASEGQSIRYLVPDRVAGYIAEHNLYRRVRA
jgi:nicotinate-nucleotide adenylyltransferase